MENKIYLKFEEDYGNYNLMDRSDIETRWTISIRDNYGYVKINNIPCKLFFSVDEDKRGYYSVADGIENLVEKSWDYARKTYGSTDYKKQTLNFISFYNNNIEKIVLNYEEKRKENILKQIEQLNNELKYVELDNSTINISIITEKEIERLNKWITSSFEKMSQYKEDSPLYNEELLRVNKYKEELLMYKTLNAKDN